MNYESTDPVLQLYLAQISQYPLLTKKEEIALSAKIRKGDKEAKERMINSNLRLVVKIARAYVDIGVPLLDLISEGNIGLVKAVERFDPAKGGKFSTYGSFWIKQAIKRALANQGKTIRLPVYLGDKISKLRRVGSSLSGELGREASDEEIAEEMGMKASKVRRLKQAAKRPTSLDAPVGTEDSTTVGELVRDETVLDPFQILSTKSRNKEIADLLAGLNERERAILGKRFGLDGSDPVTLEMLGDKMGVTRERIRQLEKAALSKMRRVLELKEKKPASVGLIRKKPPQPVKTTPKKRKRTKL